MNHLYYRLLVVGLLIMGFSSYAFLTPPTISFAQPSQPFSTTAIIQPTIIDNPVTAIDAVGDIIIAWAQYDDSLTTSNVYAGRYNSTTSAWDIDPTTGNTYTLLSTLGNDNISANPQIAMHFLGNAFVSWFDNDGVYASQYILGTGWDASPTTLSNNITVGTVQAIRIAINSNSINPTDPTTGTAIVVWSNTTTVYANTYSVGVGWEGTPDAISTYTINQINPNIAFDGIGNAMAVWNDVTASKIITRYYDATTGWQSAAPCSGIFSPDSSCSPAIAATKTVGIAAPAGDFMCVFQGTSNTVLYSVLYDYNWQSVLIIQPAHPHSVYLYPSVQMDQLGNATALWQEVDTSVTLTKQQVLSSNYNYGVGWSAPATLASSSSDIGILPTLAADVNGNMIGTWYSAAFSDTPSYFTQYAQLSSTGTWYPAFNPSYSTNVPEAALIAPQIAINDFAQASCIWAFGGAGGSNIYFAAGSQPIATVSTVLTLPSGAQVQAVTNGDMAYAYVLDSATGILTEYAINLTQANAQVSQTVLTATDQKTLSFSVTNATAQTLAQANAVAQTVLSLLASHAGTSSDTYVTKINGQQVVQQKKVLSVTKKAKIKAPQAKDPKKNRQKVAVQAKQDVVPDSAAQTVSTVVDMTDDSAANWTQTASVVVAPADVIGNVNLDVSSTQIPSAASVYRFYDTNTSTIRTQASYQTDWTLDITGTRYLSNTGVAMADIDPVVAAQAGGGYIFGWATDNGDGTYSIQATTFNLGVPQNWLTFVPTVTTLASGITAVPTTLNLVSDSNNMVLNWANESEGGTFTFNANTMKWAPVSSLAVLRTNGSGSNFAGLSSAMGAGSCAVQKPLATVTSPVLRNRAADSNVLQLWQVNQALGTAIVVKELSVPGSSSWTSSSATGWDGVKNSIIFNGNSLFTRAGSGNQLYWLFSGNVTLGTPTLVEKTQTLYRYPRQSDLVNTITWQAAANQVPQATSYQVYSSSNLPLATIDASAPLTYSEHNVDPAVSTTYYVYALDGSGNTSLPLIVTLP